MEKLVVLCLMMCTVVVRGQIPDCTEADLQYSYTECDPDQNRWRVSVPNSGKSCRVRSPKAPVKGPRCDKSCDAGKYLDVGGNQDCENCEAGTYSVGDGVRYDQWTEIPKEFTISQSTSLQFFKLTFDCSNSTHKTWVAQGEYLEGIPADCNTDLTITAELIKPGTLTVKYSNSLDVIGFIQAKSVCQSSSSTPTINDLQGTSVLMKTKDDEVGTAKVEMEPGKNKITFTLVGLSSTTPGNRFIIRSIEISGMGFSTECTGCKPGYYSSSGSSHCTHCAENTYASNPKATKCKDCNDEEFAPPGSSQCKPRPPCTENDYYTSISPCVNKTTYETYDWLNPKYCNDKHADSVGLPNTGKSKECPPCNPGQALNTTGVCEYCAEGKYSDGSKPCESCPLHTEARKTLSFKQFDVMPKGLFTSCIKTTNGGSYCDKQSTWVPKGSYIQVSDGIDDMEFAVLNINVSRFSNVSIDGRFYGRMVMRFDLTCEPGDPCLFHIMQEDTDMDMRSIQTWNTSSINTVYRHNFTTPGVRIISVVFGKSIRSMGSSSLNTLKIYELSLINTVTGGAAECTECMLGGSADKGCHSCSVGEVIVTNNATNEKSCHKCPPNHMVLDSYTCLPCGSGLVSSADYASCVSNCDYTSVDGMRFHLAPLSGSQAFHGVNMFTADGTSYYHSFSFVMCFGDSKTKTKPAVVTCINNATAEADYLGDAEEISSLVCRETILPAESVFSIQPTSLGDQLVNITTNNVIERKKLKEEGGVPLNDDELTLHYRYMTSLPTEHCTNGLTTVITLICDTREPGNGTKSLPPKCFGGTCDGCHYQMVWRTELACPKCEDSDYEKIVGECVHGNQTVRYIPHRFCPMTEEIRSRQSSQECTLITATIKIASVSVGAVVLLLLACAICCWKRSRKLEYKYMKLVEGAQGNAGELPAAQTCAWSDDDEEDESNNRVAFKTKGDKLFGKLGSKKAKGDGFEKMKLVGGSLPEI